MRIPLWTRTHTAPARRIADVVLVAFHAGPLASDIALDAARFGLPGKAHADLLDVLQHDGDAAAPWLASLQSGALRAIAEADLTPDDLATLTRATACVTIRGTINDPADLGYLQAAWGTARWLVTRGASTIFDARAMRFWSANACTNNSASAPFTLEREIRVVSEPHALAGQESRVVFTRGLLKLARPDLVTIVAPAHADAARAALTELADRLADGYMPEPSELVTLSASALPVRLSPAPPGNFSAALGLDNEAWLVTATDGTAPAF